ncbi:unnamed protein product [Lymnaea stagnalis]|uniref:Uncharacterized protein n=1 Tax=Lymnaea stagnalis TaxID=6523 RepID=A0AAV2IPQ3_LYMST
MPGYSLTDQHKVTKVKDTERFHTIPLHQAEPGTHLTKHGNTNPAFIPDNFDEQTETPPDISVTNGGPADSIVINGGTSQSIITHGGPPDSIVTCGGKQDSTRKPLENGEKRLNLLAEDGVLPTAEASGLHRVYRQRWLMLGLFCLYSFSNAFQWIHLNIISNVLANYYNASLPEDSYQVWKMETC